MKQLMLINFTFVVYKITTNGQKTTNVWCINYTKLIF